MRQLQGVSPIASASASWQGTVGKQPPPAARESEDPLWPEGMDSIFPTPMATPTYVSAGGHSCWHPQLCPSHFSTAPTNLAKDASDGGHPSITWLQAPSKGGAAGLLDELLQLQEKMNVALEQLLANRATMDFWHKELELNAELMACLNDAQFTEAVREAEVCHATAACVLQQGHRDSVLMLEHKVKAEEGQDCQAFMEAFGLLCEPAHPRPVGHSCTPTAPDQ